MTIRVGFPFFGDTAGGSHLVNLSPIQNSGDGLDPVIAVHQPGPMTEHLDNLGVRYDVLGLAGYLHRGIGLAGYGRVATDILPKFVRFLLHREIGLTHAFTKGRVACDPRSI